MAAAFLIEEDFREAETAAAKFLGIVVADESDAFLADLREINFPCALGEHTGIRARSRLGIRPLLLRWISFGGRSGLGLGLRLANTLVFALRTAVWVAASAFLFAAALALDAITRLRISATISFGFRPIRGERAFIGFPGRFFRERNGFGYGLSRWSGSFDRSSLFHCGCFLFGNRRSFRGFPGPGI